MRRGPFISGKVVDIPDVVVLIWLALVGAVDGPVGNKEQVPPIGAYEGVGIVPLPGERGYFRLGPFSIGEPGAYDRPIDGPLRGIHRLSIWCKRSRPLCIRC